MKKTDTVRVLVIRRDFSIDNALRAITTGKTGGTAIFIGTVRDSSPEGNVSYLDYEAFVPMARKKLELIRARAIDRFGARDIIIIHRLGRIKSGAKVVLIAAAAVHRDAAFKACRFVIEELKKAVPIWKRENGRWTGTGPLPRRR